MDPAAVQEQLRVAQEVAAAREQEDDDDEEDDEDYEPYDVRNEFGYDDEDEDERFEEEEAVLPPVSHSSLTSLSLARARTQLPGSISALDHIGIARCACAMDSLSAYACHRSHWLVSAACRHLFVWSAAWVSLC
jgi:hypothetical protein